VRDGLGAPAERVLGELDRARVWAVLTRIADDDRSIPPPLEPMLPALAETVLFWSAGRRQVLVVHDEQSALTAGRLRRLQQVLADRTGPWPSEADVPRAEASPLAGLLMVAPRHDPRVQVGYVFAFIDTPTTENGY